MGALSALTILGAVLTGCEASDEPRGSQVDRPAFQADRAMAHVQRQVDFGPRAPGAPGHGEQLEWMVQFLAEAGATVELDRFDYETTQADTLALTNVLARFRLGAEQRLLLLTHWDTRPKADQARTALGREAPVPGANDGASGTAVLLELATLMKGQIPPIGIDLLFVDGEDYGPTTDDMFMGAERFAETRVPDGEWTYAVLLDMVGDADPLFPIEGNSASLALSVAQRVWGIAADLGYGRYFPTRVGQAIQDDHLALNAAGLPTIDIIDFSYGPGNGYWHTPDDTVDKVSTFTLGMVGEVMAELIYRGG